MKKFIILSCFSLLSASLLSQQTAIKGKVINKHTNEELGSVSIMIKGSSSGTYTDDRGNFVLNTTAFPVTILLSAINYEPMEINIDSKEMLSISLTPAPAMGEEIVLSATRVPTRILESPVSIERLGLNAIRTTPTTSYYDATGYLKGVDLTTSSLTFKTISTRGFNGSGSTRVNQLVDGMDNQAPGLNFFLGSFLGLTELDVENVEILPGASSALYGPGGVNGTILINSKNPFKYQGLSVMLKQGVSNINKSQRDKITPFHDFSFRWAKAFNNKFAFKLGAQYISATDWLAGDSSNYSRAGTIGKVISGTRQTDPNYDGVNVYGDETKVDLKKFIPPSFPGLPAGEILVSRTGYAEKDVIEPETKNIRLSAALHYKLNEKLEAQVMGYWATGNTIYTGNNRYVLNDVKLGQYKLELKHPDWFIRSYTTQENAGESYSATVTPVIFNEAWKRSYDPTNVTGSWYPQYTGAFLGALQAGVSYDQAHNIARQFADQGRPEPGSAQFKQIFDQVRKVPIPKGGLFLEKSQLWMTEGQYNFSKWIKFVEIIAGANWKNYILNSKGTLFIDTTGPIHIKETGAYAQATKKLFNNSLTLSFSGRYDKNDDFKGRFTPRATALLKLAKKNNLRFSYQTAYRFPSTQQKYIRLDVGDYTILGGLPWVQEFLDAGKSTILEIKKGVPDTKPYVFPELKPESVQSFELGYKGLISKKLLIDAYGYWGRYENFLGRNALYHANRQKVYSTVVNSPTKVKTYGYGLGLDYRVAEAYSLFFNGYSDVLTDVPPDFQAYFNAPKYRFNLGFASDGIGKKKLVGFNVSLHWQDAFNWDGELANGPVNAFSTLDAQVSYKLTSIRSMIRVGATNLTNHYYKNAFANPEIGGVYYLSFGYNIF